MNQKEVEYLESVKLQRKEQEFKALHSEIGGKIYHLALEGRSIDVAVYLNKAESPVIFCCYGGGFILGTAVLDNKMWETMREITGTSIVSIGYRKAPDHVFPDAIYDVFDSIQYIEKHKEEFGIISDRYFVCGFSAGANLAIAACMLDPENKLKIKKEILFYPYIDLATSPEEKGHPESHLVKYKMYAECYLGGENPLNPLASPLYADYSLLAKLPDAVIILAERDPLHAEGARFACRLRAAGVPVDTMVAKNMFHGYAEHCFKGVNPSMDPLLRQQMEEGIVMEETIKSIEYIKELISE